MEKPDSQPGLWCLSAPKLREAREPGRWLVLSRCLVIGCWQLVLTPKTTMKTGDKTGQPVISSENEGLVTVTSEFVWILLDCDFEKHLSSSPCLKGFCFQKPSKNQEFWLKPGATLGQGKKVRNLCFLHVWRWKLGLLRPQDLKEPKISSTMDAVYTCYHDILSRTFSNSPKLLLDTSRHRTDLHALMAHHSSPCAQLVTATDSKVICVEKMHLKDLQDLIETKPNNELKSMVSTAVWRNSFVQTPLPMWCIWLTAAPLFFYRQGDQSHDQTAWLQRRDRSNSDG